VGLSKRKAAYVEYAQAVPLKYAIDGNECIFIKKGKCGACKKICPTGAVDFDQKESTHRIQVGSIVLSAGFSPFNPSKFDNYQYAKLPNVITSMEFERMLSASGPTAGHVKRLSKDGRDPKKIAWFQCVGSRDMNKCDNAHCSSVCCMYAIKEAVIAKEHAGKGLDCAVFFMDMRTHGKEFERFYDEARDKHGVRFIRSKVHSATPVGETDDLEIRYVAENGELKTEVFDLIVLSVGMEISPSLVDLAKRLHIDLTPGKFCSTSSFAPVATSRDGIFVCGAFQGPKDIPQSVIGGGRRDALRRPQHPDQDQRESPRGQRRQRAAADRGLRLPLRHQHRRRRGRAVGRRVRENPAVRGIRNRQPLRLLPGHPGVDLPDHPGEKPQPRGGGGLHPEDP
jgi:heterodisulfide reductase subunit A